MKFIFNIGIFCVSAIASLAISLPANADSNAAVSEQEAYEVGVEAYHYSNT